ncbi:MAG: peptide MFS transporter [Planctomycetota bacterium]|jgi:POT family proton-dependent oligopeptide transporter
MTDADPTEAQSTRDAEFEEVAMHGLAAGAAAPVKLRHPGGLYILFFAEMWERFSFDGMKAFLVFYMTFAVATGGLGWSTEDAGTLYGWYTGLVYLTPIIGGYLADRFLGTHYSMVIGGLIIAAGHFTLAFQTISSFFTGLALIVIGTGFFKPCVSVMVGQLYAEKDSRRDAAFTIFYMGINLGAFLGPIVCGGLRVAKQTEDGIFGWHWAFAAAGVGMVLGLIVYAIGRPFLLRDIGMPPTARVSPRKTMLIFGIPVGLGAAAYGLYLFDKFASIRAAYDWMFGSTVLAIMIGTVISLIAACALAWFIFGQKPEDRGPVAVIFIMAFFVFFFWTSFEQAGLSMNLFAQHRVDRSLAPDTAESLYRFASDAQYGIPWWSLSLIGVLLLGAWAVLDLRSPEFGERRRLAAIALRVIGLAGGSVLFVVGALKATGFLETFFPETLLENPEYPAEWFQSVNPMFILILAPLFASMWVRLGRRGREPSTPLKFAAGLILLGTGFIFMVMGAQASSGGDGSIIRVSAYWLMAAYCVHTMGELCLSPVGLSMVTKLSPPRFVSLLMGVWFLSNFAANVTAGKLGGQMEKIAERGFILEGLAGFFLLFVLAPIAAGVVVLALTPWIKRLMGRHG